MANISTATDEKIITINKWYGVNQAKDGDTKLKYGEASVMRNFVITRDGNLRRRPGQTQILSLGSSPIKCLWDGMVSNFHIVLAATNSKLYFAFDGADWTGTEIGPVDTSGKVSVFGFEDKAYILDGAKYRELYHDGNNWVYQEVTGYRPLVLTATSPAGSGTTVEQINKLSGSRRVEYSPDGVATVFQLPESDWTSVDYVNLNGSALTVTTDYTVDLGAGTVTFVTLPAAGTNTVEIGYTISNSNVTAMRTSVEHMRFAELYNGSQDTRVFLYGDGTNESFYSGVDTNGQPRADYFPDMNEMAVGEANTPITAMIRHYGRLIVYKTNSTWSAGYTEITMTGGQVTAGFVVTPVNKTIGNVAPGQAQVVLNNPRTLFGNDVYEWRSTSKSGNLTNDERQAQRISDRIQTSLGGFILENCICFDDNPGQQYFICYNGLALVHNYVADAWYYFNNFDAVAMCNHDDRLYFGTSTGKIEWFTDTVKSDNGTAIDAYWESGAMDFKSEWMRKYTSALWVAVKPETNSYVEITAMTDRKSDFAVKEIARGTTGFPTWDFRSFSFNDNTQPQIKKLRLKAKKYVYYKLIFRTDVADTTCTILSVDIRVRETGYAK